MKQTKYNSEKVTVDGIAFDSKDEARFYEYLKDLKTREKILNFDLQPKFVIIPSFKYQGKTEREATYTLDFKICKANGKEEYIDVKSLGTATQQGQLKFKLLKSLYPELDFKWICRNKKYGNQGGWILYNELKKIYNKKKKEKTNSSLQKNL